MPDNFNISVVIPNYNRCNELLRAVKSVLSQTYPVLEVIICDDGSTDNSKSQIAALNNPKLIWVDCGKTGGPAIPRNTGIKLSRGNWVAFLDNDDEWKPEKIEKQINALKRQKLGAVCSNASQIRAGVDRGSYLDYRKEQVNLTDLMLRNCIICSTAMVNKQLLVDTSLFPEGKEFIAIEDYALWLRLSTRTDFVFLNETLINYFDNFETSIRTKYSDSWLIFGIVFNDFKKWLTVNKVNLTKQQKKDLELLFKKIKNKGVPSQWDEFLRKFKDKFGFNK